MYQLSILLPSKYPDKCSRFIKNLQETMVDFYNTEIVICLDEDSEHPAGTVTRDENIVITYASKSIFRGSFFEACWRASTGRFLLMANDDILFRTMNWDAKIPYDKYPDDIVMFYFRDNQFNEHFACHPIWSRKVMNINPDLFKPSYAITKCDNTIWDIHPPTRKHYIDEIVIDHLQTPYGPEWQGLYEQDNRVYMENYATRMQVKAAICSEVGIDSKIMIGVVTAEIARSAQFYDHFTYLEKPNNSIATFIHGQSIANNRNRVAEQALIHQCSHLFFLDDDVICKPDTLYKLLSHDKDIICAVQTRRNFPHHPLLYSDKMVKGKYQHLQLHELVGPNPMPVFGAGLGCVLIKTDVFERLEKPWFRFGEFDLDQMSEDIGFYNRAKKAGIQTYCDLTAAVGHIANTVIRPVFKGAAGWIIDYDTNGDGSVAFPPPRLPNGNS